MAGNRSGDASFSTDIFHHNMWATLKLLDFCAGLSDEQLRAKAVGAFGSIRATLTHLVGAEVDYVCRFTGHTRMAWMSEKKFPGFDVLKDSARWAGVELSRLAATAPADAIVREEVPDEGVAVEYSLAGMLVQAITHSTEHRTQVSAIITQLGLEPPDMAAWAWMEETGDFREFKTGAGAPASA